MTANSEVNVKDFGAVGDGVTDDTSAIQAALSFVYANQNTASGCLLYTSPSPRDRQKSRMPSSA